MLQLPIEAPHRGGEQFFNYVPRAVVVCGTLSQFVEAGGTHVPKFSSFELYRRSLQSPDIVTFDELHDRASAILEAGLAARETQAEGRGTTG